MAPATRTGLHHQRAHAEVFGEVEIDGVANGVVVAMDNEDAIIVRAVVARSDWSRSCWLRNAFGHFLRPPQNSCTDVCNNLKQCSCTDDAVAQKHQGIEFLNNRAFWHSPTERDAILCLRSELCELGRAIRENDVFLSKMRTVLRPFAVRPRMVEGPAGSELSFSYRTKL
jgi:hypothetical protein